ncbi:MAG: hypothetical protein FWC71_11875, partial [Defluviitaleaceae bacterium]|nr:hypothetical protein [Defluviitaleaceae bacterium]
RREYATAKQAQSAAHQFGREGVLSELYGVTNWNFDFRGHKLQGDWQAALGVTLRVHHLTWVSMAGEAKRDYPASIGYQSPWYKEYPLIEDHFARVNAALTRGKPIVRIAVIHPVESLWAAFGPNDKTAARREELERQFTDVIEWLLFGQMDFDFISESLLPDLHRASAHGGFRVGEMTYSAVVVPGNITLRATTLTALTNFADGGGDVVYMGILPVLAENGTPCNINASPLPFAKTALLQALAPHREVEILRTDGLAAPRWIYQLRQDDETRWLFICNGTKPANPDLAFAEDVVITLHGTWQVELYNTMTGDISPLAVAHRDDKTQCTRTLHMHDSVLLRLMPAASNGIRSAASDATILHAPLITTTNAAPTPAHEGTDLPAPHAYTLSEPNVLLLDRAVYAFDDGAWEAVAECGEDILRIDNAFRDKLGYPQRRNQKAQPWTLGTQPPPEHTLRLRFTIQSQISLEKVHLALENATLTQIIWHGENIASAPDGYYTDKSIQTVPLPELNIGENILELHIPFGRATDVENCFLLGSFGVTVHGADAVITPLPVSLPFGDITHMGFPFYGGNITYHCRVPGGERVQLAATHFTHPLLTVDMNGRRVGSIAFAPYHVDLGTLAAGVHDVDITAFGNRVNTFGAIHNANASETWFGPDAWRTTGTSWSNEYRLKPTGILVSPRYFIG